MSRNCTNILLTISEEQAFKVLSDGSGKRMWRLNGLLLLNAILMGVVVGVGVYAVAATIASVQDIISILFSSKISNVQCTQDAQLVLVFLWAGLVVVIGINASAVVAGDAREGRNIDPPVILLIKAIWISYLTFSIVPGSLLTFVDQLFVMMFAKLLFKYYAFYRARRSFALGRSPRLIAGYMAHYYQQVDNNEHAVAVNPALIVVGEDSVPVERLPRGYSFRQMPGQGDDTARSRSTCNRLVTLDRVWRLDDTDVLLQKSSMARPKDLCFSLALFKLLRCRIAKYTVHGAGFTVAQEFFRDTLLKGVDDYERAFRIITDELSFIHDYYNSSLPIYYSHHLLPLFSIFLSLYSIGYCVYVIIFFALSAERGLFRRHMFAQLSCKIWCSKSSEHRHELGNVYSGLVPLWLVLVVLVLAETKDIVCYICSNWTKVFLIYHHVNEARWQRPPFVQKCIGFLLKRGRCKLMNNWNDKMNLCSVLEVPMRIPLLLAHLLHLRDWKKKAKVPGAVKAAIFQALEQLQDGGLTHILPPSSPVADEIVSGHGKRPAASAILAWHVATGIFEVRHPQPSDPECHKIAATHLSRYCAYLVTYCPELLPDDDEWCRSLYEAVKKDACRVLSAVSPRTAAGNRYEHLVQVLGADGNHEVLRDGAMLAKQLVDSKTGWEALAGFWGEMILYVAPSENLEAHAEAIARGGELITLVWALLFHAGIVSRPAEDAATAATSAGVV